MSLYAYQVFEIVAQQKSFTKASTVLNLTPSAVSHAIAKLESEIGLKLFIRSRSGVVLTSDGERIRPLIRNIQHASELFKQEIDQIHGLSRGTVRLGTFNSVSTHWLPQIVKSFRASYPDIDIQVFQGGYNDILSWIKTNTVDLAFVVNNIAKGMNVIPLHNDRLVCIAPTEYRSVDKGFVSIEEVKTMNMILPREGYDAEVLDLFSKYNMNVHSSYYVDESIIAMVEAGFGFCIASELVMAGILNDVQVLRFRPDEYRLIGLVTSDPHTVAPATRKMRQHIITFIENHNLMNV